MDHAVAGRDSRPRAAAERPEPTRAQHESLLVRSARHATAVAHSSRSVATGRLTKGHRDVASRPSCVDGRVCICRSVHVRERHEGPVATQPKTQARCAPALLRRHRRARASRRARSPPARACLCVNKCDATPHTVAMALHCAVLKATLSIKMLGTRPACCMQHSIESSHSKSVETSAAASLEPLLQQDCMHTYMCDGVRPRTCNGSAISRCVREGQTGALAGTPRRGAG